MHAKPQAETAAQIAQSIRCRGTAIFRVMGSSMLPAVPPGCLVHVRSTGLGGAQPGKLAVFLRSDRIFVHRVVSLDTEKLELVTRGDALAAVDPPVVQEEFLGIVTAIIRPRMQNLAIRSLARLGAAYRELKRQVRKQRPI